MLGSILLALSTRIALFPKVRLFMRIRVKNHLSYCTPYSHYTLCLATFDRKALKITESTGDERVATNMHTAAIEPT